jgi:tight adherence protein B
MRLLAALCAAVFVYLATGYLTGRVPRRLTARLTRPDPTKARRQEWLNQSGARVTPLQFWSVSLGSAAAVFLVVYALTGAVPVALAPAVLVGFLPRAWFARQRDQLTRQRLQAWPDALRQLANNLSASTSLHRALCELGTVGPVPLRPVFARYRDLSAALDQKAALDTIRAELADPTSDRIIEVLLLAFDQGSATVLDIIRQLADTATRDVQLAERIETAQLEQKLNARAVVVLPYVVLIVLAAPAGPFRDFYSSPRGAVVIAIGAVLSGVGMVIINRLGRQPVEPRVLGGTP